MISSKMKRKMNEPTPILARLSNNSPVLHVEYSLCFMDKYMRGTSEDGYMTTTTNCIEVWGGDKTENGYML